MIPFDFELNEKERSEVLTILDRLSIVLSKNPDAINDEPSISKFRDELSAIGNEARTRSLTYYASHTYELVTYLQEEAKAIAIITLSLEKAGIQQQIDDWVYRFNSLSPYLALLDDRERDNMLQYFGKVYTNREKIYRDIQKGQRGRTGYVKLLNGPGLNNGLRASKRRMKRSEKITSEGLEIVGEQVIEGVQVALSNFDRLNLTDNTRKILHILTIKLTEKAPYGAGITAEQIAKARSVNISLDEYMSLCGLSDRKEALKQLRNNAYTLFNISMTWNEEGYVINPETGRKRRKKIHWSARLFDSTREVMNLDEDPVIDSTITFNFSYDLVKYLCQKYIMPFNLRALSINSHNHPHACALADKLMEHYNENIAKHKHIRISVESLLKACSDMLRPEEVKENAKSNYLQRIREPFERAMLALRYEYGIIEEWHYCNGGGELPTDEQQTKCKFKDWLQWLVEYTLADYPERPKPKSHKRRKDTKPKAIALPAKSE